MTEFRTMHRHEYELAKAWYGGPDVISNRALGGGAVARAAHIFRNWSDWQKEHADWHPSQHHNAADDIERRVGTKIAHRDNHEAKLHALVGRAKNALTQTSWKPEYRISEHAKHMEQAKTTYDLLAKTRPTSEVSSFGFKSIRLFVAQD